MDDQPTLPADEHLRWIYIVDYATKTPCGMRTWYGDYRCDIKLIDGKYDYWISECWNSSRDVYWTKSRTADSVFAAMADGEKWIREMQDALVYDDDEDDDE
jgi:hypothetical protein